VNFIGLDVRGLDLGAFVELARLGYLAVYLAWLSWLWRSKRWAGSYIPILLALVFWIVTSYPLQRPYGLGDNMDRQRNLGWCATAAAGNRVWESGLYGKGHLEPLWAAFVSTLALRRPASVRTLYPFLPAIAIVLVGLSLVWVFRRIPDDSEPPGERTATSGRALLVVFFVLLASSQPLDFVGAELGWPGKYFMLKPNHTMAFALVPISIRILAMPLTWRRAVLAAAALATLGWAFVIFWVVLCWGLLLHVAVKAATGGWKGRGIQLSLVLLVQLALVAPYVYYLRSNFPHAVGLSAGKQLPGDPDRSPWLEAPPVDESLLFVVTTRLGVVFYLGLYGMWRSWRRRNEFHHLWLAVAIGAYLAWAVNAVLYVTARARGATHLYLFLVLVMAVFAGLGAHDLLERGARALAARARAPWGGLGSSPRLGAIFLLVLLPITLPWWWRPDRMDGHFRIALDPVETRFELLGDWILANTRGTDVICAGREALAWIPALTGRRALPPRRPAAGSTGYREECSEIVYSGAEDPVSTGGPIGVSVLVSDPALEAEVPRAHLDRHPRLEKVFEAGNLTVYRFRR
jgi:hypothetical protein